MTNPVVTLLAATASVALITALKAEPASAAPAIKVADARPGYGKPYVVRISGLKPGQKLRLIAQRDNYCRIPRVMQSSNLYVANASGEIDIARSAPVEGTYKGADATGPFWSMTAVNQVKPTGDSDRLVLKMDAGDDGTFEQEIPLERGRNIASAERIDMGPGFPGASLYVPAGVKRPPVVIALGGSEGSNLCVDGRVALFVDSNIAVLTLPYYSPLNPRTGKQPIEGLPPSFADIAIDRLEQARDWLRYRPEVDASRIGLWGVSKGAEMALLGATLIDGFGPVAAIVPSDVVWEGWGVGVVEGQRSSFSWRGKPLPFVPYQGMRAQIAKFARGEKGQVRVAHDDGRLAHPDRIDAAKIAVERIKGPLLIAGGDKDQTWDSGGMTRLIAARRRAAGLPVITLVYPEGSHYLGGDGLDPTDSPAASREVFTRTIAMFREAFAKGGSAATHQSRRIDIRGNGHGGSTGARVRHVAGRR